MNGRGMRNLSTARFSCCQKIPKVLRVTTRKLGYEDELEELYHPRAYPLKKRNFGGFFYVQWQIADPDGVSTSPHHLCIIIRHRMHTATRIGLPEVSSQNWESNTMEWPEAGLLDRYITRCGTPRYTALNETVDHHRGAERKSFMF